MTSTKVWTGKLSDVVSSGAISEALFGAAHYSTNEVQMDRRVVILEEKTITLSGGEFKMGDISAIMDAHGTLFEGSGFSPVLKLGRARRVKVEKEVG